MIWSGSIDQVLCWWSVRSWDDIQMVYRSMRDDSRVADELYIKRALLALVGFLFFSVYSFSCIAKQFMTLKQLRLQSRPDLFETNIEPLVLFPDITIFFQ